MRWRERSLQGLTIVVSILLALLADAAWGYRADRADELLLLEGLRTEFVDWRFYTPVHASLDDVIAFRSSRALNVTS